MAHTLSYPFVYLLYNNKYKDTPTPELQILKVHQEDGKRPILVISDGVHYMHAVTTAVLDGIAPNTIIHLDEYDRIVIDGHVFLLIIRFTIGDALDEIIGEPFLAEKEYTNLEPGCSQEAQGASVPDLTKGVIADIAKGCPPSLSSIVLQVLDVEQIPELGTSKHGPCIPLYTETVCEVSDGVSTMLAISRVRMEIDQHAILHITKYEYGTRREFRYIIINESVVVGRGVPLRSPKRSLPDSFLSEVEPGGKRQKEDAPLPITPISELMPHTSGIRIHVLVCSRTAIIAGRFTATVRDDEDTIRVRVFAKDIDTAFEQLKPGCSCYITGARLVLEQKSQVLCVGDFACIEQCKTKDDLVLVHSFTPLRDIVGKKAVDVLCAVVDEGKLVQTDVDGRTMIRRTITVVDPSCCTVSLTFWGQRAVDQTVARGDILAISDAVPKIYRAQHVLDLTDASCVGQNLDDEQCMHLEQWWQTTPKHEKNFYPRLMEVSPLQALQTAEVYPGDHLYIAVEGSITVIDHEKMTYAACNKCNKRVKEDHGQWFCDYCHVETSTPVYRYKISVRVDDGECTADMVAFDEAATVLLGVPADELLKLRVDECHKRLDAIAEHRYHIACTVSATVYRDSINAQYAITSVAVVDK